MVIKERALAAVKTSYAKYGLKAEELDQIAITIAGGLTDETTDEELNNAVKGIETYAKLIQSVGSRKQKEIEDKYKGWTPPKKEEETTTTETTTTMATQPTGLTEEKIAKMISDGIAAGLAPYQKQQEAQRLAELLGKSEKLKDVPASFRSKYTLEKEEDLETLEAQITADYTALKQEMFNTGTIVAAPTNPTPENEGDRTIAMLKEINQTASN